MAAFRGIHVSPAKQSYACLPRKCDYRTDRQTPTHTHAPDKVIPMCRYASQATQKYHFIKSNQLYNLYKFNQINKQINNTFSMLSCCHTCSGDNYPLHARARASPTTPHFSHNNNTVPTAVYGRRYFVCYTQTISMEHYGVWRHTHKFNQV